MMALGFRAALVHKHGSAGKMLAEVESRDPNAILQSKYMESMLRALPLLIECKIAPASWSAFSIDVWTRYIVNGTGAWNAVPSKIKRPRKGTPPNPSWVYSIKRLETRTDWFGWHESFFRGGRIEISEAHRALMLRYEDLQDTLLGLPQLDEGSVKEAVRQMLTPKTYARLAKEVQADYDYKQEELDVRALGGEWLW